MGRLGKSKIFPELALFESEEERKEALGRFNRRVLKAVLIWSLTCVALVLLDMVGGLRARLDSLLSYPVFTAVVTLLIVGFWVWALRSFGRKSLRRFLREQLVAKGVPICLHCGYDLRGQVEPRCPECGKAFDAALLKHKPGVHPK